MQITNTPHFTRRASATILALLPVFFAIGFAARHTIRMNRGARLAYASSRGNVTTVRALLDNGYDANADGYKGTPPVYWAALRGHDDVLRLLLEHGANVKGRDGAQALRLAAQQGHSGPVQLLLRHGANPNARNAEGNTALKLAEREKHANVVSLLKRAGAVR